MFSNKDKQANRSWVYKKLNELCQEADIDKKIGTHTMRQSRATHLLNRGFKACKSLQVSSAQEFGYYQGIPEDNHCRHSKGTR